jgi:hypothetical protein
MNNRNQINKGVDLINCEGPILKAKCIDKEKLLFHIYDEWKEGVGILTKKELIHFLNGFLTIRDSKGRKWNVNELSLSMINSFENIDEEFQKQGVNLFDEPKSNLNILYLNGFQSPLIEPKREILERFGCVIAPYIDHHNEEDTYTKTSDLIKKEKIDVIIGSSMGGALGFLLSSNLNIPALLFNPAVPYIEGEFNPSQNITEFQKCVIGNMDSTILPNETLHYLRRFVLPTLDIKIINDLQHSIPVAVFKKEINIFMSELKSKK